MKNEQFKYVVRNITRKKKQSFFTLLCIGISSCIILGNIALNNGLQYKLKEGINQAVSGQLTIYKAADSKINILESQLKKQKSFAFPADAFEALEKSTQDLVINKRIRLGSLISYEEETSYVNIHALEKDHMQRMAKLLTLQSGEMPESEKGILISETTAEELKCQPGDTILLLATNIHDYMSDQIAVISGVFEENGIALFLNYNAFVPYPFGEELVQLESGDCLEFIINSSDNKDIPAKSVEAIQARFSDLSSQMRVATWEETVPLLYRIVNVWQSGGYMTQIIFVIFSLLVLVNLTTLIIHSRKREFGTLLVFGFSWWKISCMLVAEYLIVTGTAVLLGGGIIVLAISGIHDPGIYIASKDMQAALMTEYLRPILYMKDLIYIFCLFGATTILAVAISIGRIKGSNPIGLINRR